MPIYEYQCAACGHHAEFLEKRGAPATRACPACKRRTFRRLISAAAFHLKGTGWYATDFKTKPADKRADKAADKKSADKGGGKTEDKTGDKSADKTGDKGGDKSAKEGGKKSGKESAAS